MLVQLIIPVKLMFCQSTNSPVIIFFLSHVFKPKYFTLLWSTVILHLVHTQLCTHWLPNQILFVTQLKATSLLTYCNYNSSHYIWPMCFHMNTHGLRKCCYAPHLSTHFSVVLGCLNDSSSPISVKNVREQIIAHVPQLHACLDSWRLQEQGEVGLEALR
jgi:hypothetical protein